MVELRKDYILDKYVIVAKDRSKRPDEFKVEKEAQDNDDSKSCFFCPGKEKDTPPEITRVEDEGNWIMRVFDNKFPIVGSDGDSRLRTDNIFFTYADAVGKHEVIVETPNHDEQLWDFDESRIKKLLRLYSERIKALKTDPSVKYVSVFKNHGLEGGASIKHSHSQIVGYNIYPESVRLREKEIEGFVYGCPYCRVIETEKKSYRRMFETEGAVSFAPYASQFLFESWIFPKRHVKSITKLEDWELDDMADMLAKILYKLKELNVSYNFYIMEGLRDMHAHIVIAPRLAKWAGFEFATGTVVNPVAPEDAAKFFRG